MSPELRVLRQIRNLLTVIAVCAVVGVVHLLIPEAEVRALWTVIVIIALITCVVATASWWLWRAMVRHTHKYPMNGSPLITTQNEPRQHDFAH